VNLNLGCGNRQQPDSYNVDIRKTDITDFIWDLENTPWPFAQDEQFENIYAIDIVEHILRVLPFMDECWRIMKPDGLLNIRTTFYLSPNSYRDPTHFHFFTWESFDYWDPRTQCGKDYEYSDKKFWILERNIDGEELVFMLQKKV